MPAAQVVVQGKMQPLREQCIGRVSFDERAQQTAQRVFVGPGPHRALEILQTAERHQIRLARQIDIVARRHQQQRGHATDGNRAAQTQ